MEGGIELVTMGASRAAPKKNISLPSLPKRYFGTALKVSLLLSIFLVFFLALSPFGYPLAGSPFQSFVAGLLFVSSIVSLCFCCAVVMKKTEDEKNLLLESASKQKNILELEDKSDEKEKGGEESALLSEKHNVQNKSSFTSKNRWLIVMGILGLGLGSILWWLTASVTFVSFLIIPVTSDIFLSAAYRMDRARRHQSPWGDKLALLSFIPGIAISCALFFSNLYPGLGISLKIILSILICFALVSLAFKTGAAIDEAIHIRKESAEKSISESKQKWLHQLLHHPIWIYFLRPTLTAGIFVMLGFACFGSSMDIGLAVSGDFSMLNWALSSPAFTFSLLAFGVAFIANLSTHWLKRHTANVPSHQAIVSAKAVCETLERYHEGDVLPTPVVDGLSVHIQHAQTLFSAQWCDALISRANQWDAFGAELKGADDVKGHDADDDEEHDAEGDEYHDIDDSAQQKIYTNLGRIRRYLSQHKTLTKEYKKYLTDVFGTLQNVEIDPHYRPSSSLASWRFLFSAVLYVGFLIILFLIFTQQIPFSGMAWSMAVAAALGFAAWLSTNYSLNHFSGGPYATWAVIFFIAFTTCYALAASAALGFPLLPMLSPMPLFITAFFLMMACFVLIFAATVYAHKNTAVRAEIRQTLHYRFLKPSLLLFKVALLMGLLFLTFLAVAAFLNLNTPFGNLFNLALEIINRISGGDFAASTQWFTAFCIAIASSASFMAFELFKNILERAPTAAQNSNRHEGLIAIGTIGLKLIFIGSMIALFFAMQSGFETSAAVSMLPIFLVVIAISLFAGDTRIPHSIFKKLRHWFNNWFGLKIFPGSTGPSQLFIREAGVAVILSLFAAATIFITYLTLGVNLSLATPVLAIGIITTLVFRWATMEWHAHHDIANLDIHHSSVLSKIQDYATHPKIAELSLLLNQKPKLKAIIWGAFVAGFIIANLLGIKVFLNASLATLPLALMLPVSFFAFELFVFKILSPKGFSWLIRYPKTVFTIASLLLGLTGTAIAYSYGAKISFVANIFNLQPLFVGLFIGSIIAATVMLGSRVIPTLFYEYQEYKGRKLAAAARKNPGRKLEILGLEKPGKKECKGDELVAKQKIPFSVFSLNEGLFSFGGYQDWNNLEYNGVRAHVLPLYIEALEEDRDKKFDSINLQEVSLENAEIIRDALKEQGFKYFYVPSAADPLATEGSYEFNPEVTGVGSGLFTASRYPIVKAGFRAFKNAQGLELGAAGKGIAGVAILKEGKIRIVFNTHQVGGKGGLQNLWPLEDKEHQKDSDILRDEQAALMLAFMDEFIEEVYQQFGDRLVAEIFVGDVNHDRGRENKVLGYSRKQHKSGGNKDKWVRKVASDEKDYVPLSTQAIDRDILKTEEQEAKDGKQVDRGFLKYLSQNKFRKRFTTAKKDSKEVPESLDDISTTTTTNLAHIRYSEFRGKKGIDPTKRAEAEKDKTPNLQSGTDIHKDLGLLKYLRSGVVTTLDGTRYAHPLDRTNGKTLDEALGRRIKKEGKEFVTNGAHTHTKTIVPTLVKYGFLQGREGDRIHALSDHYGVIVDELPVPEIAAPS